MIGVGGKRFQEKGERRGEKYVGARRHHQFKNTLALTSPKLGYYDHGFRFAYLTFYSERLITLITISIYEHLVA
jgi:hypothetical protein